MNATAPMRRLWLMRHAEAQVEAEGVGDHARALTRRGIAEATRAARRCLDLDWQPEFLLASSAARAQQTAEIVARGLGIATRRIQVVDALYLADPKDILAAVARIGPRIARLLVVAHNPGISACAQQLAPSASFGMFDTAGIALLETADPDWTALSPDRVSAAQYSHAG